jgi:hypothetical protein
MVQLMARLFLKELSESKGNVVTLAVEALEKGKHI